MPDKIILAIRVMILLAGLSTVKPAQANDCLTYGMPVTLRGETYIREGCGDDSPNCNGSLAPRLILKLNEPVCVALSQSDRDIKASINPKEIQLDFFSAEKKFEQIVVLAGWSYEGFPENMAGKAVQVEGRLTHPAAGTITGVDMNCTSIKLAGDNNAQP